MGSHLKRDSCRMEELTVSQPLCYSVSHLKHDPCQGWRSKFGGSEVGHEIQKSHPLNPGAADLNIDGGQRAQN